MRAFYHAYRISGTIYRRKAYSTARGSDREVIALFESFEEATRRAEEALLTNWSQHEDFDVVVKGVTQIECEIVLVVP